MKILFSYLIFLLVFIYNFKIYCIKFISNNFNIFSKTSIENKLWKYKSEISKLKLQSLDKFRRLNEKLKSFKLPGEYNNFNAFYKKNFFSQDDINYEEDIDLNIKILNITFINDIDLIIKKNKINKNFFYGNSSYSSNDDVCYVKINMSLINKTISTKDLNSNNNHFRKDWNSIEKDLKNDIEKMALIQKVEINRTNFIDKEVIVNNNLKFLLNNHLKNLQKFNNITLNSYIIKTLSIEEIKNTKENNKILEKEQIKKNVHPDTNDRDKKITNESEYNNTHNQIMIKVKKILNVDMSNSTNKKFLMKNLTDHTPLENLKNKNSKIIDLDKMSKENGIKIINKNLTNIMDLKILNQNYSIDNVTFHKNNSKKIDNYNIIFEFNTIVIKNSSDFYHNGTNSSIHSHIISNFGNISINSKTNNTKVIHNINEINMTKISNKTKINLLSLTINNITKNKPNETTSHYKNYIINSTNLTDSDQTYAKVSTQQILLNDPSKNKKKENDDNDFSIVIYKITFPDEEDINTLSYILGLQSQQPNFSKICYQCLDSNLFMKKLNQEIRAIKQDMLTFSNNVVFTRQELIVKFSDYINRVNLIKIQLFEMKTNLDLLKSSNCPNYDDNQKNYDIIMKKANMLIEIIQDSIRKQNLNVNFIIIT